MFKIVDALVAAPPPETTMLPDKFPNNAAITNYYTATGFRGPGPITGEAARMTVASYFTQETSLATLSTLVSAKGNHSGPIETLLPVEGTGSIVSLNGATFTSIIVFWSWSVLVLLA